MGPLLRRQLVHLAGPRHPLQDRAGRPPRQRRLLAAAALLALAAPACGGGDEPTAVERIADERRDQAQRAAERAGLPDDVADFVAQAAGAVGATFTVVYDAGGTRTTLAQRPPDRRIDVVSADAVETLLRLGDGTYACDAQRCRRDAATPPGIDPDLGLFAPSRLDAAVTSLANAEAEYAFAVEDKQVAGVTARCLVTTPKLGGRADELCIAPSGAIVRIRSASRSLEAASYKAAVDPKAFELPQPLE